MTVELRPYPYRTRPAQKHWSVQEVVWTRREQGAEADPYVQANFGKGAEEKPAPTPNRATRRMQQQERRRYTRKMLKIAAEVTARRKAKIATLQKMGLAEQQAEQVMKGAA